MSVFRDCCVLSLLISFSVCSCIRANGPQRRLVPAAMSGAASTVASVADDGSSRIPLLRFPDVHDDTIVFVHGEDIWSAPARGGEGTRLTVHDGAERFPKFSRDGKLIAFTGAYDGNSDVYVMDRHGGNIRRVTYHPGYDEVVGWPRQGANAGVMAISTTAALSGARLIIVVSIMALLLAIVFEQLR